MVQCAWGKASRIHMAENGRETHTRICLAASSRGDIFWKLDSKTPGCEHLKGRLFRKRTFHMFLLPRQCQYWEYNRNHSAWKRSHPNFVLSLGDITIYRSELFFLRWEIWTATKILKKVRFGNTANGNSTRTNKTYNCMFLFYGIKHLQHITRVPKLHSFRLRRLQPD